eukprot:TRINITY_DN11315_c0_g2_i2.p1 TRINITY_DN11315_c0_g2~~TRINITY_DN11315_c0_g2_i2.p1  ORF type:complete len:199 (-),score=38.34 TRINITY_DN11315_c0_g2_i2:96-692(-)
MIIGSDGNMVENMVDDKGNGTYRVWYTPITTGKYTIHVKLDGVPIKGSPFRYLEVVARKQESLDLTRVVPAYNKEGRKYSWLSTPTLPVEREQQHLLLDIYHLPSFEDTWNPVSRTTSSLSSSPHTGFTRVEKPIFFSSPGFSNLARSSPLSSPFIPRSSNGSQAFRPTGDGRGSVPVSPRIRLHDDFFPARNGNGKI